MMYEKILKDGFVQIDRLKTFGFSELDGQYSYSEEIPDTSMAMHILIDKNGTLKTKVVDKTDGSEYILHLIDSAQGEFVGRIRKIHDEILSRFYEMCCDTGYYKTSIAKETISYIERKYGNSPEYLWDDENAAIRRSDNRKWYAVLLKVNSKKLGLELDRTVEVLNIKMSPSDVEKTIDNVRFFPAYHMSKTHWISILLSAFDNTKEITALIDKSYILAK